MFKVAKFDSNTDADIACKELFANSGSVSKNKNKVKKGKITKKVIKKKSTLQSEEKIKNEVRAILQNGVDLTHAKKIKKKKKGKATVEEQKKTAVQKNESKTSEMSILKIEANSPSIIQQKKGKRTKKNLQVTKEVKSAKTTTVNSSDNTTQQKKKKRKKKKSQESPSQDDIQIPTSSVSPQKTEVHLDYKQKKGEKLKEKLQKTLNLLPEKKQKKNLTLREKMMQKLQAARFRYINEQIYSTDSKEAQKIFTEYPDAFQAYHEGYRQQVSKWPLNPVDVIIKSIQRLPKTHIVADFGCGDAKLAKSVPQQVHSFDLVAADGSVTACNMARVPLQNGSVDVAVFCLSLMGTNLHDYLLEANRVLKPEGILKIAEVESRFDDVNQFIEALKRFHFKNTWRDLSHNLFYFLDFKKEANIKNKKKLPTVSLRPCLYKKR